MKLLWEYIKHRRFYALLLLVLDGRSIWKNLKRGGSCCDCGCSGNCSCCGGCAHSTVKQ